MLFRILPGVLRSNSGDRIVVPGKRFGSFELSIKLCRVLTGDPEFSDRFVDSGNKDDMPAGEYFWLWIAAKYTNPMRRDLICHGCISLYG